MSDLKLVEKFIVDAPVEWVWKLLLNAEQLVTCLPGAQLEGREAAGEEEEIWTGGITFKVGVLSVSLAGQLQLSDVDYYEHSFKLSGQGDDKDGDGTAKVVVTCKLLPISAEGIEDPAEAEAAEQCSATIEAEAELSGRLARMDRVLFGDASKGLFTALVQAVRTRMAGAKAAIERESLRSELDSLKDVLSESAAELEALKNPPPPAAEPEPSPLLESGDKKNAKKRRSSSANMKLMPAPAAGSAELSGPVRALYKVRDVLQLFGRKISLRFRELMDGPLRRLLRRGA